MDLGWNWVGSIEKKESAKKLKKSFERFYLFYETLSFFNSNHSPVFLTKLIFVETFIRQNANL